MPDPKAPTFDRARLTPEGFVRDPKGDVLIIPDGVLTDDVPEWAAFVRESLLPHTRATIRAGLKGGYSVYTMFDKDGGWWDTHQITPAGTAPSIRLARFHAFQALAQRVLDDDPTNTEAIFESVFATQAIARGDREPTFGEVLRDVCLITAAMNTAEAAKKLATKKVTVKITDPGASAHGIPLKGPWESTSLHGIKACASDYPNLYLGGIRVIQSEHVPSGSVYFFNNTGKDILAGSLISAAGTVPTPAPAPVPPVEKPPEVAVFCIGVDTRLFDRWFNYDQPNQRAAYKDSGEFKNLSAYAYADKWGVYVGDDVPNIEGNEGSFEQNLVAAERAYQRELGRRHTALLVTGQGNIEVRVVPDGEARPVGEWYAWIHNTSRRFKVYSDNADDLYARADRDGWWVSANYKTLAKGSAGSLEANTRAAERLYVRYAADKDAEKKAAQAAEPKPPEVVTVGMFADRPIGRWFRRTGSGQGLSWIFEKTPGEGFSADVSDMSWYVRENGATVVRGCEGSYEKNLIAADKAYRNLLAAKAAKAPAPPPAPAKDRYEIRPNTVDVYTTPTHIAIGQVWRTKDGDTAMVSVVTTFEDNYAADANGEVLGIEYDKTGRITDYGDCTYVGYVPVVWLDKVPSGG